MPAREGGDPGGAKQLGLISELECSSFESGFRIGLQWMEFTGAGTVADVVAGLFEAVRVVSRQTPMPGEFRAET